MNLIDRLGNQGKKGLTDIFSDLCIQFMRNKYIFYVYFFIYCYIAKMEQLPFLKCK